jgi:hypothetical protein
MLDSVFALIFSPFAYHILFPFIFYFPFFFNISLFSSTWQGSIYICGKFPPLGGISTYSVIWGENVKREGKKGENVKGKERKGEKRVNGEQKEF